MYSKQKIWVLFSFIGLLASCTSSEQLLDPMLSLKPRPKYLYVPRSEDTTNYQNERINELELHKDIHASVTNSLQVKYASLLRVEPEGIRNYALYNFIEDWYGVRHRTGGNDKSGIDCSGFAQRLYENVYCTNLVRTAFQQFHKCRLVKKREHLKEGDLVFFRTRGKKRITHVGIYLKNNFFVHSSNTRGVMISSLKEDYWSRTYAGAGKVLLTEDFSLGE
ncbi:MAG TPA: NlpC/P60 family protein [Flavipsychrobacter sp.]|nr:NlpC/P60 family protein [Flavipsychrobacter sp.]